MTVAEQHDQHERLELGRTVRSVLARKSSFEKTRAAATSPAGYNTELWSTLCGQVGVAALAIPEEYGGLGAGIRELQIVAEELGRGLTPTPFLGSSVLAARSLVHCADEDANRRLLPPIAHGTATATLAWTGVDGQWRTDSAAFRAEHCGEGSYHLSGTAEYVLDGDTADCVLAIAHIDGENEQIGLFEVDIRAPGVVRTATPTMDSTRRLASVALTRAVAKRIGTADFEPALNQVRDEVYAVLAAEQIGAADQALADTVSYSKERVQFGRPIGSFQALKHRMADLYVFVESARAACYEAADVLDGRGEPAGYLEESEPASARAALVARIACTETLTTVAAEMIQVHGGVAITWEHNAHLYFKRAHSSSQLFGQPRTTNTLR
ncbi:acyl-CoA dehydrogenase family protein [Hoyosella subflava]|uniref:Acyl-CoA dehydrogenase n=1 Tax=Hoyosella subflava (strain DSM 45089 / JCM 17490 / NBRC 109087 / DQS3-9A1) TaxID=443218 RepID=F6EN75_HOYSD|nr:acyl-CoA dehydrogenase family protein [Hoyosella subflava]AEF39392.1 Acyl-CoA dehydrogenase [Hoyosella subflava DQS3-9A1]